MQEICELSSETTSNLNICLSLFSRQEGVSVTFQRQIETFIWKPSYCDYVFQLIISILVTINEDGYYLSLFGS